MAKSRLLSENQMHMIAKARSDPRRYEILRQIGAKSGALACTEVRGCQPVSAATLSHHIKELESAGLITITRKENSPTWCCCAAFCAPTWTTSES